MNEEKKKNYLQSLAIYIVGCTEQQYYTFKEGAAADK